MNKQDIRSQLLSQRKQLTRAEVNLNSQQVIKHITESQLWHNARHIAIYFPFNGEIDLAPMLQERSKGIYLPAITGLDMQFQCHRPNLIIRPHKYGIMQPDYIGGLKPPKLDLCLMPLVGYDLNGNRLGMGGGYYDRYFADNQTTTMVGVAHHFQQVEQLPADPWDVKLQHIFTEQGHHEF